MRVRVALALLVLLAATMPLGCGGDDAPAEPLALDLDFTDGTVLYLVERAAPPGTASPEDAVEFAKTLRERVAGAPFPDGS